MKLFKRKQRDTRQSAGELFQFEQLTGVTPIEIEPSEEIIRFIHDRPREAAETVKKCGADAYNTDMFEKKNQAAFAPEAERYGEQFDRNLHTIYTIYQIHRGKDAYLAAQEHLCADDIEAAEAELQRLEALRASN